MDASAFSVFFPRYFVFSGDPCKVRVYFRLAQVLNFTQFINTVQSLSYCCDDSLVSRGRGGKKHLKHIFTRSFQSSFLLFYSLLPNEKRPVLCDLFHLQSSAPKRHFNNDLSIQRHS